MRILGLDPGLRHTGWGIVDKQGPKLTFVAAGVIGVMKSNKLNNYLNSLKVEKK